MPPTEPEPNLELITTEPSERELRGLRRLVETKLEGRVLRDTHIGRVTRIKQAPGKFASVGVPLANCGRDHVLVDIPLDDGGPPMRACLVCDAGRELLGLNGKPI